MGLDMYAFSVSAQDAGDNVVDLERGDESGNTLINSTELFYWRKFNALHGWMEQLYRAKGGTAESFNCNTVRLTSEDLDKLERDANNLGVSVCTTGMAISGEGAAVFAFVAITHHVSFQERGVTTKSRSTQRCRQQLPVLL